MALHLGSTLFTLLYLKSDEAGFAFALYYNIIFFCEMSLRVVFYVVTYHAIRDLL